MTESRIDEIELKKIREKYPDLSFHNESNSTYFQGNIKCKNKDWYIKILFEDSYPIYPPRVFLYENDNFNELIIVPSHQYPEDHSLCIYPDYSEIEYWYPNENDIIDIISRLKDLIKKITVDRKISSIHKMAYPVTVIPIRLFEEMTRTTIGFVKSFPDIVQLFGPSQRIDRRIAVQTISLDGTIVNCEPLELTSFPEYLNFTM